MKLDMRDFWPLWDDGKKRKIVYKYADGKDAMSSVFEWQDQAKTMAYHNYAHDGSWHNTWYYRYVPGFGIAEWRDDYPPSDRFLSKWFSGGQEVVMMGEPIGWGSVETLGGSYVNHPAVAGLKCWFPRRNNKALQLVRFEELSPEWVTPSGKTFRNVLRLTCVQNWQREPPTLIEFWFAKGVGPVAIKFFQWTGEKFNEMPVIFASEITDT